MYIYMQSKQPNLAVSNRASTASGVYVEKCRVEAASDAHAPDTTRRLLWQYVAPSDKCSLLKEGSFKCFSFRHAILCINQQRQQLFCNAIMSQLAAITYIIVPATFFRGFIMHCYSIVI